MIRVIDSRGTGKTKRLMEAASNYENNLFICKNDISARTKALAYGIRGLNIINYSEFYDLYCCDSDIIKESEIFIDELELFSLYLLEIKITGYSLTTED